MPIVDYRESPPPHPLAHAAAAVWRLRGDVAPAQAWSVLPDGSCDLLLRAEPAPAVLVVGAMRSARQLTLSGPQAWLGIRLHPGAAGLCLGLPARELTDAAIPLAELDRRWRDRAARLLGGAAGEHLPLIGAWLAESRPPPEVTALLAAMARTRCAGVAAFARESGVGVRRLERLFARHVGLSPKEQLMQVRVRRLLAAASRGRKGWADLAAQHGFFDQAHLTHEVRRFTGMPPGEWLSQISKPTTPTGP